MNSIHLDPAVAATFRRTESGFTSRSEGGYVSCPPYVIASVALDRVQPGAVRLPDGYTAETLEQVSWITGFIGKDVNVSARQAAELAEIGRQILELDRAGKVQPPLHPRERQSVAHLVDLAGKEGQS